MQLSGHRRDVVALIGVRRQCHGAAARFEIAQQQAGREDVHLPAGVVHIVFAFNRVAARAHDVREYRAVSGATAVPDVQWTGWIRRYELDLHALPGADIGAAVIHAGRVHVRDDTHERVGRDAEIDESGSGCIRLREQVARLQFGDDSGREIARGHFHLFRQYEGDVRAEIPVLGIAWHLELNFGYVHIAVVGTCEDRRDGVLEGGGERLLQWGNLFPLVV